MGPPDNEDRKGPEAKFGGIAPHLIIDVEMLCEKGDRHLI